VRNLPRHECFEPALHGAASAAFNTSRQIGAAIGIAIFGPLLGATHDLGNGFVACVLVGAAATAVAPRLTTLTRPATLDLQPRGRQDGRVGPS
jgi:MFS transporter, DHA2 family, methylenomycin A resistance protein